jgi:uncharacterized protein (DUF302 family)
MRNWARTWRTISFSERATRRGACNPSLAHRALQADRRIGLLLPCNVIVRAHDGRTIVEALNPQVMVTVPERPDLEPIAGEAGRRLSAALESLRT